jgi:hypothetical protein
MPAEATWCAIMTKPIQFAWVSNNRTAKHRFYGKKFVEGEKTACGVRVQKGWSFWYGNRLHPRWGDLMGRECYKCASRSAAGELK